MPSESKHPLPEVQEYLDKWFPEGHEVNEITQEMNDDHPLKVDDYEPHFPRDSLTHRTLSFITDEEDSFAGYVPRNTREAVGKVMVMDTTTPEATDQTQIDAEFDKLHEAGLIEHRDDGSYELTRDGWIELYN